MRSAHLAPIALLSSLCALAACDDNKPSTPPSASTSGTASSPSASPSGSSKTKCEELNEAVWQAIGRAPKFCTTKADCVEVGPAACKVKGKLKSCVAAVSKGNESRIDPLSKKWEEAGCEKDLEAVKEEQLVCRAGRCLIIFDRYGKEEPDKKKP